MFAYKLIFFALLILGLIAYSQVTENYQNFSYYSGYGSPVYSGVTSQGAPYTGQGHNPSSYVAPEPEYY
jgi:hypothetical protein